MVDFRKLKPITKEYIMGLTLKREEKEFENIEPGTHQGKPYIIADLGSQEYQGKWNRKIVIVWELKEKMSDNRPFSISKVYSAYFSKGSILTKDLEAWRGKPFSDEELEGFNICKVAGVDALLSVTLNENKKTKVSSVTALPKGMKKLEPVNQIVLFDLDEDKFDQAEMDRLPEWIQKMIKESPEYKALKNPQRSNGPIDFNKLNADLAAEQDIPF